MVKSQMHFSNGQPESIWVTNIKKRYYVLTENEIKCLILASCGKDVSQTAIEMMLSPRTVRKYRASLLKKMMANNMPHAVRLGFAYGILALQEELRYE